MKQYAFPLTILALTLMAGMILPVPPLNATVPLVVAALLGYTALVLYGRRRPATDAPRD